MSRDIQLYTDTHYEGIPVMTRRGPLVLSYLESAHATLQRAWLEYPWLTGIRCDFSLPDGYCFLSGMNTNPLVEKFIASLRAKIDSHRARLGSEGKRVHPCVLRYLWGKEYTQAGKLHYHLVLLLNHHAYFTLGEFKLGRDNLYNRINEALASALGLPVTAILGLVHFNNEEPVLEVKGAQDVEGFGKLFYRTSYLCKYETKGFAPWERSFGCSRI